LWTWNRPVTVREVLDDLQAYREIAYTTVMTVMDNLYRKGALTREKDGRAWRYAAARSRDEHAAELLYSVLDESGDRGAALMRFVGRMRATEVDALRRALAQRQSKGRRP
jgi:predicted transcriptional regulator